MERSKDPTKIMAELLKSGAIMLAEICPAEGCNLPLFKLKSGEVVCPIHGKVHLVKTDEEAKEIYARATMLYVLNKLEESAIKAIYEISENRDIDPTEYIKWLEVLERIQRLKSLLKQR
ncbi:MAG: Sjogren's syndrome/scleroderma autoantigen 1 family protein [Desulfurococcaceae archaeon]